MKKQYKLSFDNAAHYHQVVDGLQIDHAVTGLSVQTGVTEQGEPVFSTRYHVHLIAEETPELTKYIDPTTTGHVYPGCDYPFAEARPDSTWLKYEIQVWLTQNNITWTSSLTKAELLQLLP